MTDYRKYGLVKLDKYALLPQIHAYDNDTAIDLFALEMRIVFPGSAVYVASGYGLKRKSVPAGLQVRYEEIATIQGLKVRVSLESHTNAIELLVENDTETHLTLNRGMVIARLVFFPLK
jgi:hypothetical protein